MSFIKQIVGQTAIYGLSSIIGRFLNYLLTPLLVSYFTIKEYGEISEMYAYVSFFIIVLTFGMETAFFRFLSKEENNQNVINTSFSFILLTTSIFLTFAILFQETIAKAINYEQRKDFIVYFALILSFDAITALPLAKLRQENRAKEFAKINIVNILLNIIFVLLFIWIGKSNYDNGNRSFIIKFLYNPNIGVAYIFIANVLASLSRMILLRKELLKYKISIDKILLKKMLIFSLPIMLASFAGIINETLDRILIRNILEKSNGEVFAKEQVGIYSGVYKISILISLFIQAYRYAAEPFFFNKEKDKNSKKIYSDMMTYFLITVLSIFIIIIIYIDVIKWFLPNDKYWTSLNLVPILLLANICLGIYYNQSIWYKLSNKTIYGAFIAFIGASITIISNIIFIPYYGIKASAYTTLITYLSMMIISYYLGQKFYAINYNLRKIGFYTVLFFILWIIVAFNSRNIDVLIISISVNTFLFILLIIFIYKIERK